MASFGIPSNHSNHSIFNDQKVHNLKSVITNRLPFYPSNNLPQPAPANKGQIIYDTTRNEFCYCNGSAWVCLSAGANNKCAVAVGNPSINPNVDYPTINAAVAAGETDLCVITDIDETSSTPITGHVTINLNSGVSVTNSIAAAATWFTGGKSLLTIIGRGAHIDLTTPGLSSRMTLQSGQTFLSGTDAELYTTGVRYSGSGTNTLTAGTSTIENCRFDTADTFNFNGFVDNLHVNNCFFESDVDIESPGVLASSGVIFTNNNFKNHNLIISSLTFDKSIISDNIWTGAFGITVDNTADDVVVSGNTLGDTTFSSTISSSAISTNTCSGAMTFTGAVTDSAIADNTCTNILCSGNVGGSGVPVNITGNNCTGTNIVVSCTVSHTIISGNSTISGYSFAGIDVSSVTTNICEGTITFSTSITDTIISNNVCNSMTFSGNVGTLSAPCNITGNN